jgi:hypothetical protein
MNGTGSGAWAESWTHLRVDRPNRSYCRVTFDHPPINTITATTVVELAELVGLIEEDADLNVVVFAPSPTSTWPTTTSSTTRAEPRHWGSAPQGCTPG